MLQTEQVHQFRKHLRQIERAVANQLKSETRCCGVTVAQCYLLIELDELGSASLGVLSQRLGLDSSTLSRTVESMVQLNLVKRETDPQDRRGVLISLDQAGKKQVTTIHATCDEIYARALGSLGQEGIETALKGMKLVSGILTKGLKAAKNLPTKT